jgi:hypothetical protein
MVPLNNFWQKLSALYAFKNKRPLSQISAKTAFDYLKSMNINCKGLNPLEIILTGLDFTTAPAGNEEIVVLRGGETIKYFHKKKKVQVF